MLTTLFVIIGLSFLILAHEAGHFIAAKFFKLKIDEFGFGFPPRIFARKKGETEYSLNWLPFGGFVKIAGENDQFDNQKEEVTGETKKRFFYAQPAWKRSVIILAGVLVNFVIGWLLISTVFMAGTPSALVITEVQKNSPAAEAGIMKEDIIVGFHPKDGVVETPTTEGTLSERFIAFIDAHQGEEIVFEVVRGGEHLAIALTPRVDRLEGEGRTGVFFVDAGTPPSSFFEALKEGFETTIKVAWLTIQSFVDLIRTLLFKATLLEGVVGPVGIFSFAEQTTKIGFIYLVQLLSIISINLAVINLMPFPALDGGRFFMILVEKLKGSPISRRAEGIINTFGFAFLILLMVLLTIRDIANL